ncbi:MAG: SBBP repeat-containing protein [Bryobacteraceae bacterium]
MPCPPASVIKVDPSGNKIWATLLGGPTADIGTALAVDSNGNVVLTGSTGGQFPTTPGAAIGSSTSATAFAARVTADGSRFLYSTYLPDSVATSSAIAVDAAGGAYIAGKTSAGHAFVLKLSADGSTIDYNVTLAGSGADAATAIAVDPAGNAVVAGQTTSPDFPVTAGAFQRQLTGTQNNFLVRLDPSGNLLTSTYFGGSGSDSPSSIALDGAGHIDLAGITSSLDLPTTPGVMQPSAIVPPWNDFAPAGFVAQFAPDGISLQWASYVMSSDLGFGRTDATLDVGVSALAAGPAGDIYIGGLTGPGFPVTPSAPVICFQGSTNRTSGFLARLDSNGALLDATYLGNSAGSDVESVGGLWPFAGGGALIAWHGSGNDVVSSARFGSGGWTAPACLSTDVLNSATLDGSSGFAPGELITLTGFGIGPDIGVVYRPDAQGNVPTQLAGVQVLFDGAPAPVLYAQSREINAIAPVGPGATGTPHNVTVTYNTQQFGPALAYAIFGSPGIFRLQVGQSAQAVAINQDGTLNGPMNPAARGSIVALWGTGYGQTDPPCPVGGLNAPDAVPLSPGISALIYYVDPNLSGMQLAPVLYAGSAPTLLCGIVQINFQVPVNVAPGAFSFSPAIAENGTIQALTSATIAVK